MEQNYFGCVMTQNDQILMEITLLGNLEEIGEGIFTEFNIKA